jgi:hypothetical protein
MYFPFILYGIVSDRGKVSTEKLQLILVNQKSLQKEGAMPYCVVS